METANNQFSMEAIREQASLTPEQNLAIEQRKGTAPAFTPSIGADKIGATPKLDIPTPTGATTNSALNSLTFSTATPEQQATEDAEEFAKGQETPITALDTQQQGLVDKALSAIEKLTGKSLRKKEITEEQKVPEKMQAVTDINNQIASTDREYELARRRIQENKEGKFGGAVEQDLRVLQKDYLERKADLSIIQNAANNNLTTAYEIIDQKLDLEFGAIEDELKIRKEQLEIIKPLLDKQQTKQAQEFELFLGERSRILGEQREDKKMLEQTKAQAIQLAASQGAGVGVLNAIKGATDMAGVWSAAGQFGGDILARQIQQAQLAKLNRESGVGLDGVEAISPYQKERGSRIVDSISELKGRVSGRTAGILSLGRVFPGSVQRDFKADLDTLKANIAFGELTAMREASKTGGALGQVSNVELGLLESALGSLDQGQSPKNLRKNLENIESSLNRWYEALGAESPSQTSPSQYSPGDVVEYQGKRYRVGADGDTLLEI